MSLTILRKPIKYIRISVEPSGDVVVSAPKRVSDKYISEYLESKKAWIVKAQEHYKNAKSLMAVGENEILLHGEAYGLEYDSSLKKKVVVDHEKHTVRSGFDLSNGANQKARYMIYAKEYLTAKLQSLAQAHGLTYAKVIIRNQKTKW
jgi:predicted metal-dependent hydrolase